MADTPEDNDGQAELSAETAALAAKGRGEEVAVVEEKAEEGSKTERPEHVPEKFWDAEKGEVNLDNLLKSYTELEKSRAKAAEEAKAKEGEDDAGKEEKDGKADAPKGIAELFSTAQTEYAAEGKLSDKTRKSIIDSGVPEATLDDHLAGVAALSEAMTAQVYETAGGEDAYKAAIKWAGENWTAGRIEKFDSGIDDPELREPLIKGLMADFLSANPGEGQQTRSGGGAGSGDVYTNHDEFQKDLSAADNANDAVARRKAVEKLERSRKAGSLKTAPNRGGMSRFT